MQACVILRSLRLRIWCTWQAAMVWGFGQLFLQFFVASMVFFRCKGSLPNAVGCRRQMFSMNIVVSLL